jgi:hypothetical protein
VRRRERQVDVSGFLDRLAAVHALEHRELACAFLQVAGDAVEQLGPLPAGAPTPPLGRGAGSRHGGVDVVGSCVGDRCERLLGCRVDGRERRPGAGLDECAADEQAVAGREVHDVGRLGRGRVGEAERFDLSHG